MSEDLKDFYKQNNGYCFITYSHTDEAKKALIFSEDAVLGDWTVEVNLKKDLDHGDFDAEFMLDRMKADASLIWIKDDLEQAKAELNEFEQNFESFMPKLQ